MIFKSAIAAFLLLIAINIGDFSEVAGETKLRVTASTNASIVKVGQPFTIRCTVSDFVLGNTETLFVRFFYNATVAGDDNGFEGQFASYEFSISLFQHKRPPVYFTTEPAGNLTHIRSVNSTFPTLEVEVTPSGEFTKQFYCFGNDGWPTLVATSNSVTVRVINNTSGRHSSTTEPTTTMAAPSTIV